MKINYEFESNCMKRPNKQCNYTYIISILKPYIGFTQYYICDGNCKTLYTLDRIKKRKDKIDSIEDTL